jgi:hypothetical protein
MGSLLRASFSPNARRRALEGKFVARALLPF